MLKRLTLYYCVLLFSGALSAVEKGSDTTITVTPGFISKEAYAFFPASDNNNKLMTFGFFKQGFGLENAVTTCTFSSIFPVTGAVDLRGGLLYLDTDLIFNNVSAFNSSGTILANKHMLDFSPSITGLPASYNSLFHSSKMHLNGDFLLSGTVKFRGDCSIDGRWNKLVLGSNAHIIIDKGSSLRLKNLELSGVSGDRIRCLDDSARLNLDNMRWVQDGTYSFTQGSIKFCNEVNFAGPYTFNYQSSLTSTIDSDSCWYTSDIGTLSMGRKSGIYGREPLYFTDSSSMLKMENSTFSVTSSGMRMTRGTFLGDGEIKFDINGTGSAAGLLLGDGNAADDFRFKLYPEAALNLIKGPLVHDIVAWNNFLSGEVTVKFIKQAANSYFYVKQNIPFQNVTIKVDPLSATVVGNNKRLTFNNCTIDGGTVEYVFTGTRKDATTQILDGNGKIFMTRGELLMANEVRQTGNMIYGSGDISGPICLHDQGTDLTFDLIGLVGYPITMNGGKVCLKRDLYLANDVQLTGSGILSTAHSNFILPYKDLVWTGSTNFRSTEQAVIVLNSDLDLYSTITLSGNWRVLGNGNDFRLKNSGKIVIDKNSKIRFENININGLSANKLRCFDNSSSILFDDTRLLLDADYSFTVGSFSVINRVDVQGTSTFFYQSSLTSTIASNTVFQVTGGARLATGKLTTYGREPLYFTDSTSELKFSNGDWGITGQGVRLTRGKVVLSDNVYLDMRSTSSLNGIVAGSGIPSDDMVLQFNSGSVLNIPRGDLAYNNTTPYGLQSKTKNTRIILGAAFNFYVNQSVQYQNINVETTGSWKLLAVPGKTLSYSSFRVSLPATEYEITGKRFSITTNLLDGNGSIAITTGVLPLATLVTGVGNSIQGVGNISGPIMVQPGGELTMGTFGRILSNISLTSGKLILSTLLGMGPGVTITGLGTVAQSSRFVWMDAQDKTWTGSITWDSTGGTNLFYSGLKLASTWTFSGNCIVDANGYNLDLGTTGNLVVERGSTVTIKNALINNVSGNRIRCLDDAGKVIFNDCILVQSGDATFAKGSLEFFNQCSLTGSYKFSYQSSRKSWVRSNSELTCDEGTIFSYESPTTSRTSFALFDNTAKLTLDGATLHSTSTGLQLTSGKLNIMGQCYVASDATCKAEGIIFGDGVSTSNSLSIDVFPESRMTLWSGYLVYNNVS